MAESRERLAFRKREQRKRDKANGVHKKLTTLDAQEEDMLQRNRILRRPQREPYGRDEYIALLIRKDDAELKKQLATLARRKCGKCGDALPGDEAGCAHRGEQGCWQTLGWHELMLKIE